MYSVSGLYPSVATGDDVHPLLPAGEPEPHVAPATLCARKVMLFPDYTPVPRPGVTGVPYVRLLARVNGLTQDLPPGMVLNDCILPGPGEEITDVAIADAAAPTIDTNTDIPNQQVGAEDGALLGMPTAGFKDITIDGVTIKVPDYSAD